MTTPPAHAADRANLWTAAALSAAAVALWLVLFWGAIHMHSPLAQLTMPRGAWSGADWVAVFLMWTVMMAAMMVPSAAPMVLCFGRLNRSRTEGTRTVVFVAAYLAL